MHNLLIVMIGLFGASHITNTYTDARHMHTHIETHMHPPRISTLAHWHATSIGMLLLKLY